MRSVPLAIALVVAAVGCNPSPKISQDAPTTPSGTGTGKNATPSTTTPSTTANVEPKADASAEGVKVVVAAQDSDALSLVRTERLKAKAEGRVLIVYAGAGWCEPCKRFKNAIQTGSLDQKLAKTTLLVFDADRDTDRLGAAGYKFQFIPFVALPGADGHPTDTAEARSKGSEAWRELIVKLEAWQGKGP
jgi:thiol-disulfide isomerase/thioredoxin